MKTNLSLLFAIACSALLSSTAFTQSYELPEHSALEVVLLESTEVARYGAQEAGQGAAADADFFYAIVNTVIGKYRKSSGEFEDRWLSSREGPIRHLNSCFEEVGKLFCSNSNFPEVPMASSIEVFDTGSMNHLQSLSLGILEEGSLTWFDHLGDGWIAGFAHYDERGGLNYKDHSFASIVRYDSSWRRQGGWMIPESVIQRMKPYAASGGALGPDGLLYLTGHDRPEMYVMAAPVMGPKLVHVATITIDIEGQAFAFDKTATVPTVWGISRPNREVRAFQLPVIELPEGLKPLTAISYDL